MKRWALLTVFLYVLALLLLTAPVTLVAFGNWGLKADPDWIKDALSIYTNCLYWIWLVVLMAGQLLLLLVPIDISERRLPTRRKLKVPIIVTAFFLSNLVFAAIISVLLAGFRDHAFDYFDLTLIFRHPAAHAVDLPGQGGRADLQAAQVRQQFRRDLPVHDTLLQLRGI